MQAFCNLTMPLDYSFHGPDDNGVPLNVILEQHVVGGEPHEQPGEPASAFTKIKPHGSLDSTASADSSLTGDEDDESTRPSSHKSAQELLQKAQSRLLLSEYEQQIVSLKEDLMEKNAKISTLTLQLRRATASKCDLVVACSDIEAQKLEIEQLHGKEEKRWKQLPLKEQEMRAQVEKEFMNELSLLMEQMNDLKRRHRNQVLEKDFEIAQLQETLRRMEMGQQED